MYNALSFVVCGAMNTNPAYLLSAVHRSRPMKPRNTSSGSRYIVILAGLLFTAAALIHSVSGARAGFPSPASVQAVPFSCWEVVPAPDQGLQVGRLWAVDAVAANNIWALASYEDSG